MAKACSIWSKPFTTMASHFTGHSSAFGRRPRRGAKKRASRLACSCGAKARLRCVQDKCVVTTVGEMIVPRRYFACDAWPKKKDAASLGTSAHPATHRNRLLAPRTPDRSGIRRLDEDDVAALRRLIEAKPDMTLGELAEAAQAQSFGADNLAYGRGAGLTLKKNHPCLRAGPAGRQGKTGQLVLRTLRT